MQWRAIAMVLAVFAALTSTEHAAGIRVSLKDQLGRPVRNAVLALRSTASAHLDPVSVQHPPTAMMDQRHKQFVPHVLAVRAGTAASFPDSDKVHHDVYSFSPAKTFELSLYSGTPSKPVIFNKAGVVTLGCNIHDWMLGYIYTADTPFFTKLQSPGHGRIADVPAGRYKLRIWQPRLRAPRHAMSRKITLRANETFRASYTLRLKLAKRSSRIRQVARAIAEKI